MNFAKTLGKHQCQSLFSITVADLRPATLLKKTLTLAQVFSCEFFVKFSGTPFERNTFKRLLLDLFVITLFGE